MFENMISRVAIEANPIKAKIILRVVFVSSYLPDSVKPSDVA